jgi:hypothetical protein
MTPRKPRPPTLAGQRGGNSKGLGGTFDSQINDETSKSQDSAAPIAEARIVLGSRYAFIEISQCPLCCCQHVHGRSALSEIDRLLASVIRNDGDRASHCSQACRAGRRGPGGELHTEIAHPPEWREPMGHGYQLVLSEPALFTRRGIRTAAAHEAMAALNRQGVPISFGIWVPRISSLRGWGDR